MTASPSSHYVEVFLCLLCCQPFQASQGNPSMPRRPEEMLPIDVVAIQKAFMV
jgi:hypothetical protein